MSCQVETWMWDVACENWNETFCDVSPNLYKNLNFTTIIKASSFKVADNCIYFTTMNGQLSDGNLNIINFNNNTHITYHYCRDSFPSLLSIQQFYKNTLYSQL